MVPSWAKTGAKVVCVNAAPKPLRDTNGVPHDPSYFGFTLPVEGETYTIRSAKAYKDGVGIFLNEIDNTHCLNGKGNEVALGIWRFRPIITEADDIALFKSLLNPTLVDKLDLLAERVNDLAAD